MESNPDNSEPTVSCSTCASCPGCAPNLYTEEQKAYVEGLPDDPATLKIHLLHQVRLRDNMEADRDRMEKSRNGYRDQIIQNIKEPTQPDKLTPPPNQLIKDHRLP